MVTIRKGKKEVRTTESAYENFFANNGWEKVESNKTHKRTERKSEPSDNEASTSDEWGDWSEEEPSKPLSEMNRSELEEYATKLGIDLTGLGSNKQIREAIKAVM